MEHNKFLGLSIDGYHEVAYVEWGPKDDPVPVICVHGLTRNGRDFDALAHALAETGRRVVCPDIVGRGQSGRLKTALNYGLPQYAADMTALIARLGTDQVDWVGTSMGGLIGMVMAAADHSPIRTFVLNDVGPEIPNEALRRIADYMPGPAKFDSLDAIEGHLRKVHAPFGPLTDDQWHHLTVHSARENEDGSWSFRYDPAIAVPFAGLTQAPFDMWPLWDQIRADSYLIYGEKSDLLPKSVVDRMAGSPFMKGVHGVQAVGHAPALMASDQTAIVTRWLNGQ